MVFDANLGALDMQHVERIRLSPRPRGSRGTGLHQQRAVSSDRATARRLGNVCDVRVTGETDVDATS